MTLPIGPKLDVPLQPLTVPGSDASAEVHEAFKQSLLALGKHDRYAYLHKVFVDAAKNGDLQTVSRLNPMIDGRDDFVLSEALEAAVTGGHFEIMRMIFRDRGWLWASSKFSVMACIVENYVPSNPEHRRAFMDLFGGVASERRMARLLNSQAGYADYKARVGAIRTSMRDRDPEMANWCDGQWRMATMRFDEQRKLI
jgi:hypothetical protein